VSSKIFARSKHRRTPSEMAKSDGLNGRLVTMMDPASPSAEAYRTLRTNLLYKFVDSPPKVIAITSPGRREGKTTTCANLGVALAQADNNTLIVDCDLRAPDVHKVFGLRNPYGIVDVLSGEQDLQGVCHVPVPGLKVLSTGPIPPYPAELLSSRRFVELMDQVRTQFDYVLVDTPPMQAVSDPLIIAPKSDGVLLVLDAQKTRKGTVRKHVRDVESIGARLLGTVMNNTRVPRNSYRNYEYGS
jgi:capsular exopolysaccharide synthesis family protein